MRALVFCAFAVVAGSGCTHDLDALRAGRSAPGVRGKGGGSSGNGSGGTDQPAVLSSDAAGRDAGVADAGSGPARCESCDAVPDGGKVDLRSCCRGATGSECGLTFGEGLLCLPRKAPGQPNSVCPNVHQGAANLDGCCRPEGTCGVSASMLDLGCIARQDIPGALGLGRQDPIACAYECKTDADCAGAAGGFICTEDPQDTTHARRICVNDCLRDQDCPKGHVCTLGNDIAMDRLVAYCRAPIGTAAVGDYCSAARDCTNNICLQLKGMTSFCTAPCRNNPDCPSSRPKCFTAALTTPGTMKTQNFRLCGM